MKSFETMSKCKMIRRAVSGRRSQCARFRRDVGGEGQITKGLGKPIPEFWSIGRKGFRLCSR